MNPISDPSRRAALQSDFHELVGLWSAIQKKRDVPESAVQTIDERFRDLAAMLGLRYSWAQRPQQRTEEDHNHIQPKLDPASSSGLPAVQTSVPDSMSRSEFHRHARAFVVRTLVKSLQQSLDEAERDLDVAKKSAAEAKGSSAKESAKAIQSQQREVVLDIRREIAAIRNGENEDTVNAELDRLYNVSPKLSPEAVEARLDELRTIIFTEESRNEDFYPTPDDIIERYIIPAADLKPGMRILEPSAGRGNIASALQKACPSCTIEVVEINSVRRDYLAMLGYPIVGTDFWEFGVSGKDDRGRPVLDPAIRNRYDRIVMNPPFAKGIGYAHVKRAYDLLKPGGRCVAIIPEGYLFGTSRENTAFQEWARRSGSEPFILVDKTEYNAEHDRAILINIGILTIAKPATAVDGEREAEPKGEPAEESLRRQFAGSRVPIVRRDEVDETFVEPAIITAQAHLAQTAKEDYVPDALKKPFVKGHVIHGANLAIQALTNRGGFLLADGTGTGKTMQSLIVAQHFFRTLEQPVLIFTVDERVLETSFGDDARKLGFRTPDFTGIVESSRIPQRPKKYSGLYDNQDLLGPDGNPISLYRHTFGKPLRFGINLCTYHDLSQYKGGESYRDAIVQAEANAKNARDEYRAKMTEATDRLNAQYPKDSRGKRTPPGYKDALASEKTRLASQYLVDHPAVRELYVAKEAYRAHIKEAIAQFAGATQLLIFDEAHKIKNSGDGTDATSMRAELGLALVNFCPRVMYVTATPADRPFDVLYLKKAGVFRDDIQFKSLMFSIGYEWKEPETNKAGEVIRDGGWRSRGGSQDVNTLVRANQTLRDAFDMLTEDGQMLRREIAMTNLTVEMHKEQAPPAALALMDQIEENLTEIDDNGREKKDLMQIYGRQLEELEIFKLEKTLSLVDAAIEKGKQVLVYCQTVMKGEIARASTGDVKPGAIETLKTLLASRYGEDAVGVLVGTSGDYEEYRRMENVRDFQSGKRRILIGTITSGGTGLNLDDTTGKNPRELIIVTPPLSFINVVQTVGRVVRANTKSRSIVHFVFFENAVVDVWLARLIANKFSSLNAIVKGEVGRLDVSTIQAASDGGESSVAATIATESGSTTSTTSAGKNKHSMFTKRNMRVEGWSYPSAVPLYVEVSGTPSSTVVALGGKTPTDLKAWVDANAEMIRTLGLQMNPNELFRRYNGPYIGFVTLGRDTPLYEQRLSALLNIVAFEAVMSGVPAATPTHDIGHSVRLAQDVVWRGIAAGTIGTIVRIREPRTTGDVWRYDVEVPNVEETVKAIEEYKLQKVDNGAAVIPFHPGQIWFSMETDDRGDKRYQAIRIDDVTSLDVLYTQVHGYSSYGNSHLWMEFKSNADARQRLFESYTSRSHTMSPIAFAKTIEEQKFVCVGECDVLPMPPTTTDYKDHEEAGAYPNVADGADIDCSDIDMRTLADGSVEDKPQRTATASLEDIRARVRRYMKS